MNLSNGTILLQVPKNAGGANISTAAVTAAITGTTVMWEVTKGHYIKFIALEGTARLFLNNKKAESLLVEAGQMVILPPNPKTLNSIAPVSIDVKKLVQTSGLIKGMKEGKWVTPFTMGPINPTIKAQDLSFNKEELIPTNLVINGKGTEVLMTTSEGFFQEQTLELPQANPEPEQNPEHEQNQEPEPNQAPEQNVEEPAPNEEIISKFGPAPVFQGTFTIDSSTEIITDPTIHTGDVEHRGTIFRSPDLDGPIDQFLFGQSRTFDNGSLSGDLAVFRFDNLVFAGNPLITIGEGPQNLALLSLGDIYSTESTGVLDFRNLNFVLIATAGSIDFSAAGTSIVGNELVLDAGGGIGINGSFKGRSIQAAGNISVGNSVEAVFINAGGDLSAGSIAAFFISSSGRIDADKINVFDSVKAGGDIFVSQELRANSISGGANISAPSIFANSLTAQGGIQAGVLDIKGPIAAGGDVIVNQGIFAFSLQASGNVQADKIDVRNLLDAGGTVSASVLSADFLQAGGDISANQMRVNNLTTPFNIVVSDFSSPRLLRFHPDGTFSNVSITAAYNANTLRGGGSLQFNGFDELAGDATYPALSATNGNSLMLNVDSMVFGPGGVNGAYFNGGSAFTSSPAGNGGNFQVNAVGPIVVNSEIQATAGTNLMLPTSGAGGTVTLQSKQGAVSVNNRITVSSNDEVGPKSSVGGKINLQSGNTVPGTTAISISSTGELLALLNAAAPGPGGTIKITSAGGGILVNGANIQADRGLIDIRNNGPAGLIEINNAMANADVIKIGALGTNGVLSIASNSNLNAANVLKLYGGDGSLGKVQAATTGYVLKKVAQNKRANWKMRGAQNRLST
jgi:hypothetical protein